MENNNEKRYTVVTNGSKSYYQVVDNNAKPSWDNDVCTAWGKQEKAQRIADGLNLLDALQGLTEASTKAQIMAVIKEYLP